MNFHVAGLLQEPVGATRRHEVTEELDNVDEQLEVVEPVKGQVKLTRTNNGILVDADLKTTVGSSCSRCLVDLTVPLRVRFNEEFRPVVEVTTGLPMPEPEDHSTFTIGEDHVLDLNEAFRQYALLTLPLAPLCDVACAGLCPECGRNLNEGPCGCAPPPADERWAAVAELLKAQVGETVEREEPAGRVDKRKRKARQG